MNIQLFRSVFWDDIADDMKSPAFAREYAKTAARLISHAPLIHNGKKPQ